MVFVDHLKGNSPEKLLLEAAFGRHIIAGDLAKSIVTGSSPSHVVKIQQLLGEAYGKGWKGPVGVWYNGINRDSSKYKFYPGIQSPGNGDATQGIDSVFDKDTPHSNTAWIRVECPSGSEVGIPDADTINNPPNGLTGIYECQLGDIYDGSGVVTASGQLLTNPADVIAFLCMVVREYSTSRVNWASLATLRSASNVTVTPDYLSLPQGVGLTASYYNGSNFDTFVAKRIDPVIQFPSSNGSPAIGVNVDLFSARYEGKIRPRYTETYTFYVTHDDGARLWVNGTLLIDQWVDGTGSATHSATIALTADSFYDIKLEWYDNAGPGPAEINLEWQSTTQTREAVPQDRLYPKNEPEPRFQCHIKFIEPTSFDDALRSALFTCNGTFQDANGQLRFFIISDETPSFDFDESNVDVGTFQYYPRFTQQELLNLPNRFIADGRDLNDRYLAPFDPPLIYDLPALQETAGRVIEETVPVGNTTRWQALTNLAHYAKLKTAPNVAEFTGMPQTLQVLPGDVVTVTNGLYGLSSKQFLCVEATDKAIDKDPDDRIFKLIDWA